MVTTARATGPRELAHCYRHNDAADPRVAAVLHRVDCPKALRALGRELVIGEREEIGDGWWERFGSEAGARRAVNRHQRQRPLGSVVTGNPWCCPE